MKEIEFEALKRLCKTECMLIKEYEQLFRQAKEPQLKSDLQSVCASHKNHLAGLIKLMEDSI